MYSPTDRTYKSTKKIIAGDKKLSPELIELQGWIKSDLGLNVLAIFFRTPGKKDGPQLHIILETLKEYNAVCDSYGYNAKIQEKISDRFLEILKVTNHQPLPLPFCGKLNGKNLWICYSNFNTIAIEEAVGKVSSKDLRRLIKERERNNVWTIQGFGFGLVVMYNSDQDVHQNKKNGISKDISEDLKKLIMPHDEYGYCATGLDISFDSKENFDNNYESNWYYYFK